MKRVTGLNIDIIIISSSITFLLGSIMFSQEMISRATALWILLGCSLALIAVYLIDRELFKKPDEPDPMVGIPYLEDTKVPEPKLVDDYWEGSDNDSDGGWY